MKTITPFKIFLFLIAVFGCCALLSVVIPKEGIKIGETSFKFFHWSSLTDTTNNQPAIENVEAYLASLDSLASDSLANDTLNVDRTQSITSLQFADGNSAALFTFFESLEQLQSKGGNVHVLHYGDSQIESDRMTNYLREKWQSIYGGVGPGLVCPVPITASAAISQSQSSNWTRHTVYGFGDGKNVHSKYGILGSYGRFTSPKDQGSINPQDTVKAWLEFRPSSMASSSCRQYSKVAIYMGHHHYGVRLNILADDSLISSEIIPPTAEATKYTYRLGGTPKRLRLEFAGPDSPDVQAVLLENDNGLHVDNIALRGSSGTIFRKIQGSELGSQIRDLNTKLIILQFGGNSVPGLSSSKGGKDFGNYFQSQIQYLKQLHPESSILVIGPSDMSTSVDGVYMTWPYLESVRDGMRDAAFAEGCAFWDMYSVMGGRNSMVSWVSSNPQYAGPDYTHFTPKGARKMAELLYKAIDREHELWKNAKIK